MGKKKKYSYYIENPVENNRVQDFLNVFAAVLENSSYRSILNIYSRVNMKCSRCASECMIYAATGKPEDIPCHRSSILLRIYKRHFTPGGWLRAKFTGGSELTDSDIDEMLESYYNCTACGRCTRYCPMGIDHRLIVRLGRYILSEMGIVPKALLVSTREQLQGETGNTSAIPLRALKTTLEFLEEEIEEIKGVKIKFPLDVMDAEYVFFAPVSDFLMEADTLMGIACVLEQAGVSWTIASGNYDAINYGLFYSDTALGDVLRKMIDAVRQLNGRKILIGECGHASRSAHDFLPTYNDGEELPVVNIMELTLQLIEEGRLNIDGDVITDKVTYHDPCNIARSGWIVEQPRKILNSFVKNFSDMSPSGADNYCCGGGGGTVSINEVKKYRMEVAGKMKVEQLREVGADIVVTPCANCKKQFGELIDYYKLPMRHAGLHDLIFEAIKMEQK